jgi:hypothetical protein
MSFRARYAGLEEISPLYPEQEERTGRYGEAAEVVVPAVQRTPPPGNHGNRQTPPRRPANRRFITWGELAA